MMLDTYIQEYIDSVFDKLAEAEDILIHLEQNTGNTEDRLRKIARIIHSIKGSAGGYGLDFASTLCHRFEDYIAAFVQGANRRDTMDIFFKLLDLSKKYFQACRSEAVSIEDFEIGLQAITHKHGSSGLKVLLVDESETVSYFLSQTLENAGIAVAVAKDGLTALNRLVQEEFDALITSQSLKHIDGTSLIAAIKVIECRNQSIKTILISSSDRIKNHIQYRPDYILSKTASTGNEVLQILLPKKETASDMALTGINNHKPLTKVLLIDDDPAIHKLVHISFKKLPAVIIDYISSGVNALETAAKLNPDLILLDYMMPDVDGPATLKALRGNADTKYIPVFFLSGKNRPEEIREMKKLGVAEVIPKPFKITSLADEVLRSWQKLKL